MYFKNHSIRSLAQGILFFVGVQCARLLKLSYIVGSYAACFSATNMVTPLAGLYGGAWLSVGMCSASMALHAWLGYLSLFKLLAYHIPGLCAALYWSSPSVFVRVVLPLACMALFVAHPVGGQAFLYTLYWLVPVALCMSKRNNLFLTALGSTFTAHAVGSVIWLYAQPMTAAVWLALIPVVILERTAYALGMVSIVHVVRLVKKQIIMVQKYCSARLSTSA